MLNITEFKAGEGQGAEGYLEQDIKLSQKNGMAEYLARDQAIWLGKGVDILGLGRQVAKGQIKAFEENINPVTKEKLTPRTNKKRVEEVINRETKNVELDELDNRRTGYDLCWIVPKSMSVAMALHPELENEFMPLILEALEEEMTDMEKSVKTRVRIGGVWEDRVVGNWLYARIIHKGTRPVHNCPDPFYHAHCWVPNACYDQVEGRWKALDLHDIIKFKATFDAKCMNRLVHKMEAKGWGLRRTVDAKQRMSFELTGVDQRINDFFSKRHQIIVEESRKEKEALDKIAGAIVRDAQKLGKHLDFNKVRAAREAELSKTTRRKKETCTLTEAEKLERWISSLEARHPGALESLHPDRLRAAKAQDWLSLEQARKEVVQVLFSKNEDTHRNKIVEQVLRRCGGNVTVEQAQAWVNDAFVQLDDEGNVSTWEVIHEEQEMCRLAKEGLDAYRPLGRGQEWVIQNPRVADSADQAGCVKFCLESRDLVISLTGVSGSGKSSVLKELEAAIMHHTGQKLWLLAPTTFATDNLKEKGFKGAMTFQNFQDKQLIQDTAVGDIIVLDESSLASNPDMLWTLKTALRNHNRIIIVGDDAQERAVERGWATTILQDTNSIRTYGLEVNRRQKDPDLNRAVCDMRKGVRYQSEHFIEQAYAVFKEKSIVEEPDKYREKAAELHVAAIMDGKTSILGCPIHEEARKIDKLVVDGFKDAGLIQKENHEITRIQRLDLQISQKRDRIYYQPKRVVAFHTKVAGVDGCFKPGEKWEVSHTMGHTIVLRKDGIRRRFDPATRGKWDVYSVDHMDVSVGQKVRLTQNGKDIHGLKFKNNDIQAITAVDNVNLTLASGHVVPRKFAHVDQGNVVTSFAAQGREADQCVAAVPLAAHPAYDARTLYEFAGRGKWSFHVVTDCEAALHEASRRTIRSKAIADYAPTGSGNGQDPVNKVDLQAAKKSRQKEMLKFCINLAQKKAAAMRQQIKEKIQYKPEPGEDWFFIEEYRRTLEVERRKVGVGISV